MKRGLILTGLFLGFWSIGQANDQIEKRQDRDALPDGAVARLGTPLGWRADEMLGFSADDKHLLTRDKDDVVRWRDPSTGKESTKWPARAPASTWVLSGNGKLLATIRVGFGGDHIEVIESDTGKSLCSMKGDEVKETVRGGFGKNGAVLMKQGKNPGLVFSSDGKVLAYRKAMATDIRLWDTANGKELKTIVCPHEKAGKGFLHQLDYPNVAFAPDGKTLAAWNNLQEIALWEVASGKELRRLAYESVNKEVFQSPLVFSPNGKLLACWDLKGTISLLDTASGKVAREFTHEDKSVKDVAFSPDGKLLAARGATASAVTFVWEISGGKEKARLGKLRDEVIGGNQAIVLATAQNRIDRVNTIDLVFSHDGSMLATGGKGIQVWDIAKLKDRAERSGHGDTVRQVSFSSDGKTVVSLGEDMTARVWDLKRGTEQSMMRLPKGASCFAVGPDGETLAVGDTNAKIRLVSVADGKEVHVLEGHSRPLDALTFSPDGKHLLSRAEQGHVCVWDAVAGARRHAIANEKFKAFQLGAFNLRAGLTSLTLLGLAPRGNVLALRTQNELLLLDDTGALLHKLTGLPPADQKNAKMRIRVGLLHADNSSSRNQALAFAPDGKLIAWEDAEDTVTLFEVASGKPRCLLTGQKGQATALAFAADGRWIAGAFVDGTIRLWSTVTGNELKQFRGHEGSVKTLAFSQDNQRLASGGTDQTIVVWDSSSLKEAAEVKEVAAADLEGLWGDLVGADATRAHKAMRILVHAPQQCVQLLDKKMPCGSVDGAKLTQLLQDLDAEAFDTRKKAEQELLELGGPVVPALRKHLEGKQGSLELRRRVEKIVVTLDARGSADIVGELRAIELLERLRSPEAKALLEKLKKQACHARIAEEAKRALGR